MSSAYTQRHFNAKKSDSSIKTVYGFCTKIENGLYTLVDFDGNTAVTDLNTLLEKVRLNYVDIINLDFDNLGDYPNLNSINKVEVVEVDDFSDIDKICSHNYSKFKNNKVAFGNKNIGYLIIYRDCLIDYKGTSKEVYIPKLRSFEYIESNFLAYNRYVEKISLPNTCLKIHIGQFADKLKYIEFRNTYMNDSSKLATVSRYTRKIRDIGGYPNEKSDAIIKIFKREFKFSDFVDIMSEPNDLEKLKKLDIDLKNDPLYEYVIRSKVLRIDTFNLDLLTRTLKGLKCKEHNIDKLVLPPVRRLGIGWAMDYTVKKLVLPSTLRMSSIGKYDLPFDSSNFSPLEEVTVEQVVVPKELSSTIIDLEGQKVLLNTKYGTGYADSLPLDTKRSGRKCRVVNIDNKNNKVRFEIDDEEHTCDLKDFIRSCLGDVLNPVGYSVSIDGRHLIKNETMKN